MNKNIMFWIQGVYMIPFIFISSFAIFTLELILMLIFIGWTMPFTFVALFAGMLIEGNPEPWKCKRKWIVWLSMPFVKSHWLFCKIQGVKQKQ